MKSFASVRSLASVFVASLLILGNALLPTPTAHAQQRERPRLKNFGSSLKKLKWDAQRNTTVETNPKADKAIDANEDEVVKIETSLVVCDVLVLDAHG